MLLHADSLAVTHAIAAAVAGLARSGDVIVLAGDMGAGKTAFAQGFGRALGIDEAITSPTFTLVHSYPCPGRRLTLHHADLYRLDRTADVDDLALHELAEFDGIVLVEWGDVAASTLGDHLQIRLRPDDDDVLDDDAGTPGGEQVDDHVDDDVDDDADVDVELDVELDGARRIEIEATGHTWAGRWDRLTQAVAAFRP